MGFHGITPLFLCLPKKKPHSDGAKHCHHPHLGFEEGSDFSKKARIHPCPWLFFAAVMTTGRYFKPNMAGFSIATTGVITVVSQWVIKNAVSYFLKQHQLAWSRSTIEQSLTSIIQLDVSHKSPWISWIWLLKGPSNHLNQHTLWWTNILLWKITIFHGKIHYKWPIFHCYVEFTRG